MSSEKMPMIYSAICGVMEDIGARHFGFVFEYQ